MTRFEVNFSMVVGEVSPPAAIGMRQYAAPPSAGAQSPRPQRPGYIIQSYNPFHIFIYSTFIYIFI